MGSLCINLRNLFCSALNQDLFRFSQNNAKCLAFQIERKLPRGSGYVRALCYRNFTLCVWWRRWAIPSKEDSVPYVDRTHHKSHNPLPNSYRGSIIKTIVYNILRISWSFIIVGLARVPICTYFCIQTTAQYFDSHNPMALSMYSSVSQFGDFLAFMITLLIISAENIKGAYSMLVMAAIFVCVTGYDYYYFKDREQEPHTSRSKDFQ